MNAKLAVKPSEGVYYVLPEPGGGYTVFSQRSDEVEEPLHFDYWEKILPEIARKYKLDPGEIKELRPRYTAIPRGRVIQEIDYDNGKPTGNYIVAHGGDMPLSQIKYFVLQDFGLLELNRAGKVIWRIDDHEKMDPEDREFFRNLIKKN